jgi:hypothetical protein
LLGDRDIQSDTRSSLEFLSRRDLASYLQPGT